jgi:hypothetical protein
MTHTTYRLKGFDIHPGALYVKENCVPSQVKITNRDNIWLTHLMHGDTQEFTMLGLNDFVRTTLLKDESFDYVPSEYVGVDTTKIDADIDIITVSQ